MKARDASTLATVRRIEPAPPAPRRPAMPWVARYVVEYGWLHVTLICGVGVFLLPLLWMLGVSLKTDEELTNQSWLPEMPTFVASSPYPRKPMDIAKPITVAEADWQRARPEIERITRD